MIVLPLSMPWAPAGIKPFLSETIWRERHLPSANFSAGKYDDDISNICSLRTEHIATATKSLAQTFVICDNLAQKFIPPGVTVKPDQWGDGRSRAQWENKILSGEKFRCVRARKTVVCAAELSELT